MRYPSLQRHEHVGVPEECLLTWLNHSTRGELSADQFYHVLIGRLLAWYKIVAFKAETSGVTAELRMMTTTYFGPTLLKVGIIQTDYGGEF